MVTNQKGSQMNANRCFIKNLSSEDADKGEVLLWKCEPQATQRGAGVPGKRREN